MNSSLCDNATISIEFRKIEKKITNTKRRVSSRPMQRHRNVGGKKASDIILGFPVFYVAMVGQNERNFLKKNVN